VLGWQRSTLCAEAHLRLCGQHVGRSLELGAGRDDRRQARVERYGGGRERGWLTELLRHARADHESAAQLSLRVCPQLELHRSTSCPTRFWMCACVCHLPAIAPAVVVALPAAALVAVFAAHPRCLVHSSCVPAPPALRLPDRQKPLPEGNHRTPRNADQHSYTRARRMGIIREQCKTPTAGPRQRMSRLHGPASTSSTAPVRAMPAHERLRAAVVCGRARAVPWLEAGVVEPPDL
jgi:hypothetical protein